MRKGERVIPREGILRRDGNKNGERQQERKKEEEREGRRRKQGFIGEELHAYFASFTKYKLEGDPTASGTRGKALGSPLSVEAGQQGARERAMRLSGQTCLSHLEPSHELHQDLVFSH